MVFGKYSGQYLGQFKKHTAYKVYVEKDVFGECDYYYEDMVVVVCPD